MLAPPPPLALPLPTKPVAKPVVRIFVALFDYDPPTMSPNPDACDEESMVRRTPTASTGARPATGPDTSPATWSLRFR